MPRPLFPDEDPADPYLWPRIPRSEQAKSKYELTEDKPGRKGTFPNLALSKCFFEALLHQHDRRVFHGIVSHMRHNTNGAWRYAAHYQDTGHVVIIQFRDGQILPRLTQHGHDLLEAWRLASRLAQRIDVQERLPPGLRARLAGKDSE
ncbi:MAG: hypothetical protein WDA16_00290 [Candidatus Thermoplasmatota archaeon]